MVLVPSGHSVNIEPFPNEFQYFYIKVTDQILMGNF